MTTQIRKQLFMCKTCTQQCELHINTVGIEILKCPLGNKKAQFVIVPWIVKQKISDLADHNLFVKEDSTY